MSSFRKIVLILIVMLSTANPSFAATWAELTDDAYHLFKAGELMSAVDASTQARSAAQSEFGPHSLQEALSISQLAVFHSVNREKDVAAKMLKEFNVIKDMVDEALKTAEASALPLDEIRIKVDQLNQLKDNIFDDQVWDSSFAMPAVDAARVDAYLTSHPPPPSVVLTGPAPVEAPVVVEPAPVVAAVPAPKNIPKAPEESTVRREEKSQPVEPSEPRAPVRTDATGYLRWLNQ